MRQHAVLPILALVLTLAACHDKAPDTKSSETRSVIIKTGDASASALSIDSDKFKASIEIPGVEFNGDKMDIDGMKLPQGSRIKAMRVHATDRDGKEQGQVTFDFTAPLAPNAVAAHLEAQAEDGKWGPMTRTTAADGAIVLNAAKSDDGKETLEYRLLADGSATRGSATIIGAHGKDEKSGW